jgi:hypothetical protein
MYDELGKGKRRERKDQETRGRHPVPIAILVCHLPDPLARELIYQ